jgi:hypothetical protein
VDAADGEPETETSYSLFKLGPRSLFWPGRRETMI